MAGFREKLWLIIAVFLTISLITGVVFLSIRLGQLQPTEIKLENTHPADIHGDVVISGAVARPGIYPAKAEDTLTAIISSAGVSDNADMGQVSIYIPANGEKVQPQKIDINRAEAWLLSALPGIGDGKAQLIVDYRDKNGPFRSLDDLLKIQGFGTALVDKIRGFATVGE
jgi:competence protein ComEA